MNLESYYSGNCKTLPDYGQQKKACKTAKKVYDSKDCKEYRESGEVPEYSGYVHSGPGKYSRGDCWMAFYDINALEPNGKCEMLNGQKKKECKKAKKVYKSKDCMEYREGGQVDLANWV